MRSVPGGGTGVKRIAALVALVLAAAALAACGGGDDEATTVAEADPDGTLRFRPDPKGKLAYTTPEVSAEAGKTKLEFINPKQQIHDLTIDDPEGKKVAQTYTLSVARDWVFVKLKPGEYTFYCSVTGHRDAGMKGTLTVE